MNQPHFPMTAGLILAVSAPLAWPSLTQASILNITVTDPVAYRTSDAGSPDGDDNGDAVQTGGGNALIVGDSSDNANEFRTLFQFDISGLASEIADATNITFSVSVTNDPTGLNSSEFDFQLVALTAAEDGVGAATDYSAAGTVVASFNSSAFDIGDVFLADVTSFVKDDAGQNFTGFRFQVANEDAFNNGNSAADALFFGTVGSNDATLTITIIPEPASLALLAFGGLCTLGTRRRRA